MASKVTTVRLTCAIVGALAVAPAIALAFAPADGHYSGTCGPGSGGPKPCEMSLTVTGSSASHRVTHLMFEPPSCLINNDTSTNTPLQADGSFGFSLQYSNTNHLKVTIQGKFISASKIKVTMIATCQGFGTKTRTMTLHRA